MYINASKFKDRGLGEKRVRREEEGLRVFGEEEGFVFGLFVKKYKGYLNKI